MFIFFKDKELKTKNEAMIAIFIKFRIEIDKENF